MGNPPMSGGKDNKDKLDHTYIIVSGNSELIMPFLFCCS